MIDTSAGSDSTLFPLPRGRSLFAISPDGDRAYVATNNENANTVRVIQL